MRISLLWDWTPELSQTITWQDGLAAAIKELKTRHEVQIVIPGEQDAVIDHIYFPIQVAEDVVRTVSEFKPDVILHWADMTRPHAVPLAMLGIPQAICFAGGEALGYNWEIFNHIFVESQVYLEAYKKAGASTSIAFGTNTDLFKPIEQNKAFDTIFPGTFAAWKRHDIYATATKGLRALACGYMYETHEQECWQVCLDNGVTVLPHVSAPVLRNLYAASKVGVVTSQSDGGSQRTVLEMMAMNLPVVTCMSDKFDYEGIIRVEPTIENVRNAIEENLDKDASTRDYIVENWSHINYAEALEKGLESII